MTGYGNTINDIWVSRISKRHGSRLKFAIHHRTLAFTTPVRIESSYLRQWGINSAHGDMTTNVAIIASRPRFWDEHLYMGQQGFAEYISQVIAHEQKHQSVLKVAGVKATRSLDRKALRYLINPELRKYEDRAKSGRCLTCGKSAFHIHRISPGPRSERIFFRSLKNWMRRLTDTSTREELQQ